MIGGIRLSKVKGIIYKGLAFTLAFLAVVQIVIASFTMANADYMGQLGSNKALGSPILNPNFVADDWNKWEMITWGIFLSNFTIPLIDDYNSTFNANSGSGSKGSGYKALQFGSGSDPANADVLHSLLDVAITQQKVGQIKQIYVSYTKADGLTGIKTSENNDNFAQLDDNSLDPGALNLGDLRPATLADFIFQTDKSLGDTYIKISDTNGVINWGAKCWSSPLTGYKDIYTFDEGNLPTFKVKSVGSGYETVYDYTNSWDVQLISAWFGKVLCSDLSDDFVSELNDMWANASSLPVSLDCFGNITVKYKDSNRILIPASANQYLTESKKINLINSIIFNGYMSSVNSTQLQLLGQQSTWNKWGWIVGMGDTLNSGSPDKSGIPAFGSRINGIRAGTTHLYFDMDNILIQDLIAAGGGILMPTIDYGSKVKKLFDLDIENLTGSYALKIEVSNLMDSNIRKLDESIQLAVEKTAIAASMVANSVLDNPEAQVLNTIKTHTSEQKLFADPVIIPVQADKGLDGRTYNRAGVGRLFPTFMMNVYLGKTTQTTAGRLDKKMVVDILSSSKTASELRENSFKSVNGNLSYLAAGFIANNNNLFSLKTTSPSNLLNTKAPSSMGKFFKNLKDSKYNGNKVIELKYSDSKSEDALFQRWVKAYPVSDVMLTISNILGTREGTDFATWSTYIYMTYLDWYGVTLKKELGKEPQMISDFNTRIFDGESDILNTDIGEFKDVKTEEDKKRDVLNYTYLMLHPKEGKEYRSNMIVSGISDWVYRNYSNIVYGNASSYYSKNNSNLATRNATGFLSIDSYSDNMLTGWFMKVYVSAAVWIIVISFILVIIIGLLRSRKASWFAITMLVVINTLLIVPSTGEVVPFIANKYVQQMFNGKMTFWSLLEAITNANIEKDLVNSLGLKGINEAEASQITEMVKALNVVHLDRALMLKTDISRKVTETASGNFAALQNLQSARWMLPMLMRQFTANDKSADYVYIPAGDLFDDMSNLYWFYNEMDAATVDTVNARDNTGVAYDPSSLINDVHGNFPDYQSPSSYVNEKWSSPSYFSEDVLTGDLNMRDEKNLIHTFSYLLDGQGTLISRNTGFGGSYVDVKSYEKYVEKTIDERSDGELERTSNNLERIAGEYIRSNRQSVQQAYGYLWMTENPAHYFYQNLKDMFPSDETLGHLVGKLQGTYVINADNKEVRKSFMYSYDTGNLRDIADLEGLFRNVIPYIYQMMLATGGTDGDGGLLGGQQITGYDIYNFNTKPWMFRSNWVVKIMENPTYYKPDTVKDRNGNEYKVANPTMPDCYPSSRPMIFSEAQRVEYGLNEADLTLVELKCIEINKNVSRSWTLMINYANTQGISKEVMLRQMSLNTIIEFSKEFSPATLLSGSKAMYPNGIDLRAISFDSVMKMLMLNTTKDVSYIYKDTMSNVVEDSDIFTAALLLISAFLCCYLIPLARNVVLAAIFYLGLFSILRAIVSGHKTKSKISLGYIISNLLFLVMTLVYYGVFSGLMRITTSDEVLTVQSVQVNIGNPIWMFIVIIAVSIAYMVGMYKMLNHCFKNFRDMGYEVYAELAGLASGGISNGLESLGEKITKWGSNDGSSGSSQSVKGTGAKGKDTLDVNVEKGSVDANISNDETTRNTNVNTKITTEYDNATYTYDVDVDIEQSVSEEIDKEIEKGKQIDN